MAFPALQELAGGGQNVQLPRFTPEQQQALNQLLQQGLQSGIGPQLDRAKKGFYQNTVPSLAERFTSQGGGQRSSAFQGALGQAGSDLESQLESMRSQYGLQQIQMGLTPQFENIYTPPGRGFGSSISGGLGSALPGLFESGLKQFLGGTGQSSQSLLGGSGGPAAKSASTSLGSLGSAAANIGGATAGLSGLGAKLAGLGSAAAPFAFPAAAAAGVAGLPLLLYYLLED